MPGGGPSMGETPKLQGNAMCDGPSVLLPDGAHNDLMFSIPQGLLPLEIKKILSFPLVL